MHLQHLPMACAPRVIPKSLLTAQDIAQEYAFARSDHRIDQEDWEPTFYHASVAGSSGGALVKQYPWILPMMQSMPDSLMTWLDPNMKSYFNLQKVSPVSLILVNKALNFYRVSDARSKRSSLAR